VTLAPATAIGDCAATVPERDLHIGVALSGGGSRAALFAAAILGNKYPEIKDAVRRVHVPNGTPVGTGPAEYKKALELIKAGKPIKYFGATGPIEFDANGDVTGPALVWKIKDGQIVTDRIITIEDMQTLFKRVES